MDPRLIHDHEKSINDALARIRKAREQTLMALAAMRSETVLAELNQELSNKLNNINRDNLHAIAAEAEKIFEKYVDKIEDPHANNLQDLYSQITDLAQKVPQTIIADNPTLNNFDTELAKAKALLTAGKPAIEYVQKWMSSEENRQFIFSNHGRKKKFKRQLYKKSIENMARALINIDKQALLNVNESEFYIGSYTRKQADKVPTLLSIIDNFNKLSFFVASNILKGGDINQAAFAMDYWINVAYECAMNPAMKDMNACMGILGAFGMTPVRRLFNEALNLLPEKTQDKYQLLEKLVATDANSSALRKHLNDNANAIPYIGRLLTDMTMLIDSSSINLIPDSVNGFIDRRENIRATTLTNTSFTYLDRTPVSEGDLDALSYKIAAKGPVELHPDDKLVSQLAEVEIQAKTTIIQKPVASVANIEQPKPRQMTYYLDSATDTDHQCKTRLEKLGFLVTNEKISCNEETNTLDLYQAAADVCKKDISNTRHCLMNADPLAKAIGMAYYIMHTPRPEDKSPEKWAPEMWLAGFYQALTPRQRKDFGHFMIEAGPAASKINDMLGPFTPPQAETKPNVLTIAMLGTGEHSSHSKTILTEFCDSVRPSAHQSVHLINGPGADAKKGTDELRLGTYEFKCDYDAATGSLDVHKTKKTGKDSPSKLAGLLAGKGSEDAIEETIAIVAAMMAAGKNHWY